LRADEEYTIAEAAGGVIALRGYGHSWELLEKKKQQQQQQQQEVTLRGYWQSWELLEKKIQQQQQQQQEVTLWGYGTELGAFVEEIATTAAAAGIPAADQTQEAERQTQGEPSLRWSTWHSQGFAFYQPYCQVFIRNGGAPTQPPMCCGGTIH
jgi:hypothetical protein